MGAIHLVQIEKRLRDEYVGLVDCSDCLPGDTEAPLSRALAAFVLAELTGLSIPEACESVTDGFDHGGIDAISIDVPTSRIVVVQAKWDGKGNKSPELGDILKLAQGIEDLSNMN
jgi:hypothetical protein